jgi:sigma-B regulation protein RsbU (phosphoserine phosphatase)
VSRRVELGFDIEYSARLRAITVKLVRPDTPAGAAGLRGGDRIVAVDGRSVRDSAVPFGEIYLERRPGDPVDLAVLRGDAREPVVHRAVFRARNMPRSLPALLRVAFQTRILFPFVMLAVALPVLFYRVEDAHAWRLALLFCCLLAAPPNGFAGLDGPLLEFATGYRSLLGGLSGALFYWFFAVFPARSSLDRRQPRLKWLLLAAGLVFGASGLAKGTARLPAFVDDWLTAGVSHALWLAYEYGAIALALAALVQNLWRPPNAVARRKIQVIAWGTLVGVLPAVVSGLLGDLGWSLPDWSGPLTFLALFLFPLSFAYAVVRHRVLELPVLLKRSARYLLVRRGFVVLLALLALAANALFALSFARLFPVDRAFATSVGVGFGLALASVAAPGVRRATGRIDRAFFRGAYDARVILEQLAEQIRTVASPAELAAVLEQQLSAALQPYAVVVYLRSPDGRLRVTRDGAAAAELTPGPELDELARGARPTDYTGRGGEPLLPARTCACWRRSRRSRPWRSRTCASPTASRSASTPSGAPSARWSSRARCSPSCCLAPAGGCPRSSAAAAASRRAPWAATTSTSWRRRAAGSGSCSATSRARASPRRC